MLLRDERVSFRIDQYGYHNRSINATRDQVENWRMAKTVLFVGVNSSQNLRYFATSITVNKILNYNIAGLKQIIQTYSWEGKWLN